VNDRSIVNRVFTVGLVVVACWAAVTALHWREEVRLSPLVTSLVFGALALAQLLRTEVPALRRRTAADETEDLMLAADRIGFPGDEEPGARGAWLGVAWITATIASVVLFGIVVGLPLAVLLLCVFAFRDRWLVTVLAVAATALVIWVFDQVFNIFWPAGLVMDLLS
jgi:hypothetical protein